MKAVVVFESMYGNTRHVAESIARGLDSSGTVHAVPVASIGDLDPSDYDLIVVGGPTHAHGMSRETTRHGAEDAVTSSGGNLAMDPESGGDGVREWLSSLSDQNGRAAAFDTRFDAAAVLTGRASKGIAKLLRKAGLTLLAEPESFLVDKDTHLLPGEEERARRWGEELASQLAEGS